MAEIKTKVSDASVTLFLKTLDSQEKYDDSVMLLKIFEEVTQEKPKLWGSSIIGFGAYHYESKKSTQKGDWPLTGFSPRKQNFSLYIMPGFKEYGELLKKLGTHTTGVSCLYIKRLSDIDISVLKKLILLSVKDMERLHTVV